MVRRPCHNQWLYEFKLGPMSQPANGLRFSKAPGAESKASFRLHDPPVQPGPAQRPQSIGDAAADTQRVGRLLVRQTREITQFDQLSGLWLALLQLAEGLVQEQKVDGRRVNGQHLLVKRLRS